MDWIIHIAIYVFPIWSYRSGIIGTPATVDRKHDPVTFWLIWGSLALFNSIILVASLVQAARSSARLMG